MLLIIYIFLVNQVIRQVMVLLNIQMYKSLIPNSHSILVIITFIIITIDALIHTHVQYYTKQIGNIEIILENKKFQHYKWSSGKFRFLLYPNSEDFLDSLKKCLKSSGIWEKLWSLFTVTIDFFLGKPSKKIKKKTEKSDIAQKGRVGWTPKPLLDKIFIWKCSTAVVRNKKKIL